MVSHLLIPDDVNQTDIAWRDSVLLDHREEAHIRYGAKGECLYLFRPDGYVGYRSLPPNR